MKKIFVVVILFGLFFTVAPVFAQSTNNVSTNSISCVAAAVNTREASLGSALLVYTQSVTTAYSNRAQALAKAYTLTTRAEIKTAVRTAWNDFKASMKSAKDGWKTARTSAWSVFKTSVKACKTAGDITDSVNSVSEMSGQ